MSYSGGFGGGSSSIMKVDSQEVGKIIGRGGCKIKELEQVCRARIKISNNVDEDGMKEVEIIGTDDVIEKTRRKIEDCLSGADFGGGRRGGYGGGRGRGGGGGGYSRRGDGGSWGRRDRESGDSWGRRDDYDRGGYGSGGRGGGGGYSEGGDSETIYVESSEVGRIIGRGGCRIKEMESDSGCRIKVFKDGGSQGRSSVQLNGSRSAISKAKRLIEDAGVEIVNGDDRGRGW